MINKYGDSGGDFTMIIVFYVQTDTPKLETDYERHILLKNMMMFILSLATWIKTF